MVYARRVFYWVQTGDTNPIEAILNSIPEQSNISEKNNISFNVLQNYSAMLYCNLRAKYVGYLW